jgi:excinuclease ABC subunit C
MKHFKSVRAIKEASIEELSAIVPGNAAQAVYDYYHTQEETKV